MRVNRTQELGRGGQIQNRYSFAIMVSSSLRRLWSAVSAAALSLRGLARRQFITRNRRLAFVLALSVAGIGIAAVHISASWFSPGLMILPVLAGGLLLWPRALRVLFGIVAVMLGYDVAQAGQRTGFGIVATIAIRSSLTCWQGPGPSSAC